MTKPSNGHGRPYESFAHGLWRITTDCRTVGEPVTWQKLATATLTNKVKHHGDGPGTTAALIAVLQAAYAEQGHDTPDQTPWVDFRHVVTYARDHGWWGTPPASNDERLRKRRAADREWARRNPGKRRARNGWTKTNTPTGEREDISA